MKLSLIIALSVLCGPVFAQPRQLPVVEVQGEGQVKIPLAQRGPLQFVAAAPRDSMPYLSPTSLPMAWGKIELPRARLKGNFEASLGTDFAMHLKASLFEPHPVLPHLRMDVTGLILPRGFDYQHYSAFASVKADSVIAFDTRLRYQSSDADAFQQSAFSLVFIHRADSLRDRGWLLKDLSSRLWWENGSQLHAGARDRHANPGFWHSHKLEVGRNRLENRFGSSMGRVGLYSAYSLPISFPGLRQARAGLMTDFRHLLPVLDVGYEKVFNPKLRLLAGNHPSIDPLTRSELAELYPWAGQPRVGRVHMSPLDLRLSLERVLPPFFGQSLTHTDRAPQNSLRVTLRGAYSYNKPVFRQMGTAVVPALRMEPAWQNSLKAEAGIRLPWGWLDQSVTLSLEHLPRQGGIRAPYQPLISSSTAFSYKTGKIKASIGLDQSYHQEDHLGNNLPEVADLSLRAAYQPCPRLRIDAGLANVFNRPRKLWKGIPDQGRELRIGARYQWR